MARTTILPGFTRRLSGRRDGFTMIEVMTVVAILGTLAALVLVAMAGQRKRAARAATVAMIQRLEVALDKYYTLKGEYPPDGFDSLVETEDGVPIHGSACLYYFLSREVEVVRDVAGERRVSKSDPPMEEFKSSEILESPDDPGVFVVLDAFLNELHYDNTEDGRFSPQGGEAHTPEVLDHPPDPRSDVTYGVVTEEGIQGKGYDIWSHGEHGLKLEGLEEGIKTTISSWNLGTER